jgi:hypothetical protein
MEFTCQFHVPESIEFDAEWTPEPLWTAWNREKIVIARNRTSAAYLVASLGTGWT